MGAVLWWGIPMKQHTYRMEVEWTGNDGDGTRSYTGYRRDHRISAPGKAAIDGSSDPAFRGDPSRYNPEELLVASLSACHMLWYLHLASARGVSVLDYRDEARGVMAEQADGAGEFVEVTLAPVVRVRAGDDRALALALHEEAHRFCFIARSVKFEVKVEARVEG